MLFCRVAEVVGPVECPAHGLVALHARSPTSDQQPESFVDCGQQLDRGLRPQPRGRQLDREWEAVEALAEILSSSPLDLVERITHILIELISDFPQEVGGIANHGQRIADLVSHTTSQLPECRQSFLANQFVVGFPELASTLLDSLFQFVLCSIPLCDIAFGCGHRNRAACRVMQGGCRKPDIN